MRFRKVAIAGLLLILAVTAVTVVGQQQQGTPPESVRSPVATWLLSPTVIVAPESVTLPAVQVLPAPSAIEPPVMSMSWVVSVLPAPSASGTRYSVHC